LGIVLALGKFAQQQRELLIKTIPSASFRGAVLSTNKTAAGLNT